MTPNSTNSKKWHQIETKSQVFLPANLNSVFREYRNLVPQNRSRRCRERKIFSAATNINSVFQPVTCHINAQLSIFRLIYIHILLIITTYFVLYYQDKSILFFRLKFINHNCLFFKIKSRAKITKRTACQRSLIISLLYRGINCLQNITVIRSHSQAKTVHTDTAYPKIDFGLGSELLQYLL